MSFHNIYGGAKNLLDDSLFREPNQLMILTHRYITGFLTANESAALTAALMRR